MRAAYRSLTGRGEAETSGSPKPRLPRYKARWYYDLAAGLAAPKPPALNP